MQKERHALVNPESMEIDGEGDLHGSIDGEGDLDGRHFILMKGAACRINEKSQPVHAEQAPCTRVSWFTTSEIPNPQCSISMKDTAQNEHC